MIELLVAVCLIDQPATCKDVHLAFAGERVDARQCMMRGQFEMARWVGDNPDWVIRKWTCRQAGQVAKL